MRSGVGTSICIHNLKFVALLDPKSKPSLFLQFSTLLETYLKFRGSKPYVFQLFLMVFDAPRLRNLDLYPKPSFSLGFKRFLHLGYLPFNFDYLTLSCAILSSSWVLLGLSWGPSGPPWVHLGAPLGNFRATLGPPGASVGRPLGHLSRLGAILALTWTILTAC